MSGYLCPNCQVPLLKVNTEHGHIWRCAECEGRAIALSVLKQVLGDEKSNSLWQTARSVPPGSLPCPFCKKSMRLAERTEDNASGQGVSVDICLICPGVWFDTHELDLTAREGGTSSRVKEALTKALHSPLKIKTQPASSYNRDQLEHLRKGFRSPDYVISHHESVAAPPESALEATLAVMGVPAIEAGPLQRTPLVTLSYLLFGVFLLFHNFQIGSAPYSWYSVAYFLISILLLLGFGSHTESRIGHYQYMVLLLGSAAAGLFAQWWLGDNSLPAVFVGVTSSISGIITFLALQFPQIQLVSPYRIGSAIKIILLPEKWYRFPIRTFLMFWIVLQVAGTFAQLHQQVPNPSYGGLAAILFGTFYWIYYRHQLPKTP